MRQDESKRMHQVGRYVQQPRLLAQGLTHQPQFSIFEIAQPSVDQLGTG